MRKGVIALGLEELREEDASAKDAGRAEVTDFIDAPEDDLADATEAEAEVARSEDEVAEAADTAETLETVADNLEETLPEGGVSEKEAETLEVAVEHMLKRVGFTAKHKKAFPALENFTKPEDRVAATKEAMEGIREKATALYHAIVAAIKKAIEYVKNFFTSIIAAYAGLEKRAEALTKLAKSVQGEQAGEIAGNDALVEGGKALGGGELVNAYKKHTAMAVVGAKRLADASVALKDAEALAALGDGPRAAVTAYDKIYQAVNLDNVGGKTENHEQNGKVIQELKLGIGGQSLFVELNTDQSKDTSAVAKLLKFGASRSYVAASTGASKVDAGQVKPATNTEVQELCQLVVANGKSNEALKSEIAKVESVSNELLSKLGALAKSQEEYAGDALRAASGAVRGATQVLVNGTVALKAYDTKLAKNVLDFAGASLKAYKSSKPAKGDKKAA